MAKYTVIRPIHHDGALLTAGEPVEMPVSKAEPLVDLGHITVAAGDEQQDDEAGLATMTKDQLQEYSLATYGVTLKSSLSKADMIAAIQVAGEQKLAEAAGV